MTLASPEEKVFGKMQFSSNMSSIKWMHIGYLFYTVKLSSFADWSRTPT